MKSRFWRLTLKELRETLRDRRTVGTLVLMPLLVYPLLGTILQKYLFTQVGTESQFEYRVGTETLEDVQKLYLLYHQGEKVLQQREQQRTERTEKTPEIKKPQDDTAQNPELMEFDPSVWSEPYISLVFQPEDFFPTSLRDQLESGKIDLIVRIKSSESTEAPEENSSDKTRFLLGDVQLEIEYLPGVPLSENALFNLQDRVNALNQEYVRQFMASHDINRLPVEMKLLTVTGAETASNLSIATIVPLILILMTVTGAVYPAIDLTAGERERQTLEALIAAPISRLSLLQAKYIAVLSVAVLTAMINLISMLCTIYAIGVDSLVFGKEGLNWLLVVEILGLLTVFASFFSAVLLGITSFARSFKEAQAYLIPLMLLSLAPGVFCLLPGFDLGGVLSIVPLVNIVLLGRDLFANNLDWLSAVIVISSTLIYAWLALYVAARIFGTDAILYGSAGSWSDLWNSTHHRRLQPSFTSGLICLAVLFPAFIYLSRITARLTSSGFELDMTQRSLISITITILLFVVLPSLFTLIMNVVFPSAYALRKSNWKFYLAALFLAASLWPFIYELEIFLLPAKSLERLTEHFTSIKYSFQQLPLHWKLFTYALIPAACEEYFFRGFLFGACRNRFTSGTTILVTACLFGLFHTLTEGLLYERFFPSFTLGLILGMIRASSNSLFPGILFHVMHNGLLLTISAYEEKLQEWGWGTEEQMHLPGWLLGIAGLVALAGFLILWKTCVSRRTQFQHESA